jgi:hypothetical protein
LPWPSALMIAWRESYTLADIMGTNLTAALRRFGDNTSK